MGAGEEVIYLADLDLDSTLLIRIRHLTLARTADLIRAFFPDVPPSLFTPACDRLSKEPEKRKTFKEI